MSNYIIDTSLKTKTYLANIMTRDRVFDREVGKDGLIILQFFTVFLVFVLVSQFF